MRNLKFYLQFLIVLLLVGCNPERKLERLLMKYPELRDTIVIHDTVEAYVEYVRADTTFVPVPGDTVTLTKDRLTVRYVLMAGDTVWLEGTCDADTIRVPYRIEVPVIQPTRTVDRLPWWVPLVLLLALIFALIQALRR